MSRQLCVQFIKENLLSHSLAITSVNFCHRTSLHGIKFIFEDSPPEEDKKQNKYLLWANKIMWTACCVLGTAMTLVLINLVWMKYVNTPTITTIETNNFPISNVQFPSVTFCNINKVYAPSAQSIKDKLIDKGISATVVEDFLTLLAKLVSASYIDAIFLRTYRHLEEMNYTTFTLMLEVMQPCENMIKYCMWLGKELPCDSLFRVTVSTEGFCCSFNNKALKYKLQINHDKEEVMAQLDSPVYRVAGYGESVGLSVVLDAEMGEYVSFRNSYYGIKVLIHQPDDFGDSSNVLTTAQPGDDVSVAVIPTVMVSTPDVRKLPPDLRECLFEDEEVLRATEKYTYQSCLDECTVGYMLKICGCIPFYFPHLRLSPYVNNSRQCSLHNVNCLWANSHVFSSLHAPWDADNVNGSSLETGMDCNCLPSCSGQYYRVQVSKCFRKEGSNLSISSSYIPEELRPNVSDITKLMTVNIYFKDISCIKYRRDLYMTWDSLLASFGGIFSLCLGGSIISIFELAYFFTFRLAFLIYELARKRTAARKKMTQETDECNEEHFPNYGYQE